MSQKILQNCFLILAVIMGAWLAIRFLLPIALPFLLGCWLALAAEPAVRLLNGKWKLPRWAGTALSVSAVFLLSTTLLMLLLGTLMRQLSHLKDALPALELAVRQGLDLIRQWLLHLSQQLPEGIQLAIHKLAQQNLSDGGQIAQQFLSKLPQIAGSFMGRLSSGIFGLITGIISAYMISNQLPQWKDRLHNWLPVRWRQPYTSALCSMRKALGGWIFAQIKLAGITFLLLLVGFWILRIDSAWTLAPLITLVDAFPVLGVGTVLLPWSLVCMLQGNLARGLGLLGLYAAIWLIRSVLEPKFVGKGLGLDPLLTLVAIYAGWQLLGITGMLLSPIFTMAALNVFHAWKR